MGGRQRLTFKITQHYDNFIFLHVHTEYSFGDEKDDNATAQLAQRMGVSKALKRPLAPFPVSHSSSLPTPLGEVHRAG